MNHEPPIEILVEIPSDLHASMAEFLETRLDWDQNRLFVAALSLFLLQNGGGTSCARTYLDSLFTRN